MFEEYNTLIKEFNPWIEESEKKCKDSLPKPGNLEDANALLDGLKAFDAACEENRGKLENAAKALTTMVKSSNSENLVDALMPRLEEVKTVVVERVKKVTYSGHSHSHSLF